MDRRRNDRDSAARSHSPRRRSPPMSPWSCLGPEGRPSNKTRQQINCMGIDAALRMKEWERNEAQLRDAQLGRPGKYDQWDL